MARWRAGLHIHLSFNYLVRDLIGRNSTVSNCKCVPATVSTADIGQLPADRGRIGKGYITDTSLSGTNQRTFITLTTTTENQVIIYPYDRTTLAQPKQHLI